MKLLSNVSSIIPHYDAFLLDLWGVVHDGSQLYAGVCDTISLLRKSGKKIIFLSNAPRRAKRAESVLKSLGIKRELYDHIVTSGEVGYEWLVSGSAPYGKNYFFIGAEKDHDLLYNTAFNEVQTLEKADFILNLGFGTDEQPADHFTDILAKARKLNLPMLCLNPDFEVVKISGEHFPCAGVIARDYEEIGGKATYFGKPHSAVYEHCHKLLGKTDKTKILAIGDSLDTDIKGAKNFNVNSVLVMGGILREKTIPQIEELCLSSGLRPNYLLPKFGL